MSTNCHCQISDIGVRQACKSGEQKQVPDKFVCLVGHFGIHHGVYLLFCNIPSVHAFGRVDVTCKRVEWQATVISRYGNDVFQYNHIAPYRVGATFLFSAQKILEIVDKCQIQLFKGISFRFG